MSLNRKILLFFAVVMVLIFIPKLNTIMKEQNDSQILESEIQEGDSDQSSDANDLLGVTLLQEEKYDEAFEWFEKEAYKGSAISQYYLFSLYSIGFGATELELKRVRDGFDDMDVLELTLEARGIGWLILAAEQGEPTAISSLKKVKDIVPDTRMMHAYAYASQVKRRIAE